MAQSLAKIRDAEYSIRSGVIHVSLIYCYEAIEFMIRALLIAYNVTISKDVSIEDLFKESEKAFPELFKRHVKELVKSLRDVKSLDEEEITEDTVNSTILKVNRLYELTSSHINSLNIE
jgi:HEPN domain-containing protein